jgi:hypothetical protein
VDVELDVPESVDGVVEGVVDGLVEGVDSSPMFGQSLVDVAAMYELSATWAVVGAGCAAVLDELVAACATAPPARTAVAARITKKRPERGNICVHLLPLVSTQSTSAL